MADEGNYKEITKGARWVVLTGTLNYKLLRDNYLKALKRPEVAYPHFRAEGGLDLQRQYQQDDGTWTDWENVDRDANLAILENLPEEEEELTPDEVRLDPLIDPLPFLKAGFWERVHIASLVPAEKKEVAPSASPMGGMMGGMMGGNQRGMRPPTMDPEAMGPGMMGRGMGMGGMGGMGGGGGAGAGPAEDTSFAHSDADVVMIRALDFTADPETLYRYRVRLVVYNPNLGREDVNPGVDVKSELIQGPWSEATEAVMMPADITPYAMHKALPTPAGTNPDEVSFQVTRWIPEEGATVVRNFDASPGQLIGETKSAAIPSSDGKQPRNKVIDFTSGDVVLDTAGGPRPLPAIGATGAPFDVPALSLLVRPDGSVMVRTQAFDAYDEVRKDTDTGYRKEIADATSKKGRRSSLGRNAGIMGMGGGMMGGGMMGGGMMGGNMMGRGAMGPGPTGAREFGSRRGGQMRTGTATGPSQGAGSGR